jgi:hypothetical protein
LFHFLPILNKLLLESQEAEYDKDDDGQDKEEDNEVGASVVVHDGLVLLGGDGGSGMDVAAEGHHREIW